MALRYTVVFRNSTTELVATSDKLLLSNEGFAYFIMITTWGPGQGVTILGLLANALNIAVFIKQGVRDSVNMSLFLLTLSDLGSLVFLFFLNLCWIPAIIVQDLPFYPSQMIYFLFYGHVIFTRVTTGTTAWIAIERCLCIISPMKVKSIITIKRTVIFVCVLYFVATAACAPFFYTSRFKWIFDSPRNKCVLGLVKIPNRGQIEGVGYVTNNVIPIICFVVIVLCTIVLSKALLKNARWRQRSATQKEVSNRDITVVKLVLIISLIFIICYAPSALFFLWVNADPELKIDGKQKNFLIAFFGLLLLMESINATSNFFIYVQMSSKFKATLQQLIFLPEKAQKEKCIKSQSKQMRI